MARVTFQPHNLTVEVDGREMPGELGRPGSLLDIAVHHGIALTHTCGGKCACTTCHVIVRAGAENLSPVEIDEEDRLDLAPGLTAQSRLACQAVVCGDVTVEVVG